MIAVVVDNDSFHGAGLTALSRVVPVSDFGVACHVVGLLNEVVSSQGCLLLKILCYLDVMLIITGVA